MTRAEFVPMAAALSLAGRVPASPNLAREQALAAHMQAEALADELGIVDEKRESPPQEAVKAPDAPEPAKAKATDEKVKPDDPTKPATPAAKTK